MINRHGLRVSEAIGMRRAQLEPAFGWSARARSPSSPIAVDELRAIKRCLAAREDKLPCLFVSEHQAQLTLQAVNYVVRHAGERAKLGHTCPHMLRHSCDYYLADQGTDLRTMQDHLGHRDPKHTALYTPCCRAPVGGVADIGNKSIPPPPMTHYAPARPVPRSRWRVF
jgi:type 1 fimbriae regulatory protein FimB